MTSDVRNLDAATQVFVAAIQGEIVAGDLGDLIGATALAPPNAAKILVVDSEGGDLDAAMGIGRFIRDMRFDVVIPPNAKCLSACVFLLAAGIDKRVQGKVGIHRPYFPEPDPNSAAQAIKATMAEVVTNLAEMNIPTRLAEDMFSIDPGDMRMLTDGELRDYRLNSMDYAESEAHLVGAAEKFGLSREAYEAFRSDLNYSCQIVMANPQDFRACAADVAARYGVTLPEGWLK